MSLYQRIANQLQFVTPRFYKERYFKNLKHVSKDNYSKKNIEPELIWIKDILSEDSVMLDIGANNGSFLFQLEQKLFPENLHAFEPNKKLFSRLKRIFPRVNIYPFALSDANGTAEFKIPVVNGKSYDSRGTLQLDYREEDEENHTIQKVQIIKLDDWEIGKTLHKIDFIKIDVEGNEMRTLFGGEQLIKKHQPTLMVEMEQRHHSETLSDLIKLIEYWNYTAFYLNRKSFDLEKLTKELINEQIHNRLLNKEVYINNIIFVPNSPKPANI
ncbi:FkbM family methyltransferase [Chryseobacterium sp. MP_3.2]|uniref:FkbM family methyltransferase n=1 Tax=Chryseobacterium sp. MP_3.2 TaxID=3071712 RepID=UPI002E0E83FD